MSTLQCIREKGDAAVIVSLSKLPPCSRCSTRRWKACMADGILWMDSFGDDEIVKVVSQIFQIQLRSVEERSSKCSFSFFRVN